MILLKVVGIGTAVQLGIGWWAQSYKGRKIGENLQHGRLVGTCTAAPINGEHGEQHPATFGI